MISITNDGQAITSTNYWHTAHALKGLLYLSWNAGAARLLVPPAAAAMVPEMRTGREVIISRGPWAEQPQREAFELLFEDGTDTPFAVHLMVQQSDRLPPDEDQRRSFPCAVWTPDGKVIELPARYRKVASVPDLSPWVEH
jgi:hypothetical protein